MRELVGVDGGNSGVSPLSSPVSRQLYPVSELRSRWVSACKEIALITEQEKKQGS